MIALRPFSLRASLGLTLTLALLAPGSWVEAQATKTAPPPTTAKDKAKKAEKTGKETAKAAEPIDLNSATTEELMTLPGIGEASARKIIDARPHKTVEDLAGHGIPTRTIDGIKPLVVVRPLPVAVDLNNDPLLRLETLPGVGPALAKEMVAARPFADYDDLARVKGLGAAKIESLKGRVKFGKAEKAEAAKAKNEVKSEPVKATKAEPKTAKAESKAATKEANQPGAKINLNTASLEELDALPGIGMVRAQEIVAGRPFAKIEDIMKLKGIKEVEFGKIKDQITVGK